MSDNPDLLEQRDAQSSERRSRAFRALGRDEVREEEIWEHPDRIRDMLGACDKGGELISDIAQLMRALDDHPEVRRTLLRLIKATADAVGPETAGEGQDR